MRSTLNLRQIEAFKAVIESGTVSEAAAMLNVSQPAVSKLLMHLEHQTRLSLFERVKGRLVPSRQGMRLYEEIDRIFVGVRQVESSVESIRREEQGRLLVGVMPALSGAFIQRVTSAFLRRRPDVYVSIHARSSQFIADWLSSRQLDIGLMRSNVDNPYIEGEPLMAHPLVCIMPPNHRLTKKKSVRPADLDGEKFVTFAPETYSGRQISQMFETYNVRAKMTLEATVAPTVCEFVAAGLGVSLVHPLFIDGMRGRVAVRRFEPEILFDFQMCRVRDHRNAGLAAIFVQEAREVAAVMAREVLTAQTV